uniref:EGF-like domain-containing protein n=1 Tax=Trichobilharzia regenti TaxID=157069 RepID=A0AA85JEV5_TRIRE|nr:unnamed protein product [Trichobilharzia regenti]
MHRIVDANAFLTLITIILRLTTFFASSERFYDLLTKQPGKEYSAKETVGFRTFHEMHNPQYREYENGFPPGIYGSSVMPVTIWYHYWGRKNYEDMFPHSANMFLADVNWPHIVTLCDETKYPRCSWAYFLALMQPTSYNPHLIQKIFGDELKKPSDGYFITPFIRGGCYPMRTVDQMSLIYIYTVCHLYGEEKEIAGDLDICPNPCKRRPCHYIENAISGSCKRRGYHRDDFECLCETGFKWDKDSLNCAIADTCSTLCNPTTTEFCFLNRTSGVAICNCKTGYMGYDCSQPFDACISSTQFTVDPLDAGPYIPSGNEACGVVLSVYNHCNPMNEMHTFNCTCGTGYTRDLSLSYDNCLKQIDKCDTHLCIYGECVRSKDLTESVCDCEEGYTGEKCDIPKGVWSAWSDWTVCEPGCGPARHSRRFRICLSEYEKDCVGEVEQVRSCGEDLDCRHDMSIEEITWLQFMQWTEKIMLYTVIYIGCVAVLITIISIFKRYYPDPNRRISRMPSMLQTLSSKKSPNLSLEHDKHFGTHSRTNK